MATVSAFEKGSAAKRGGLKKGDVITSVNGRPLTDILDYLYFDSAEELLFDIIRHNKKATVEFSKQADEPLGIIFAESMELAPVRCKNKCIFCFIDQLPKGLRDTLYVKDDDYRMSVICGNYVTLTNLSECDFNRIIDMKLSPLYISVHAADNNIRKNMVVNPKTLTLMDDIKRLTDNGITLHTQVVLCEGVNDGAVLADTTKRLYDFYPMVKSLAVVPVGLTGHRDGLYPLKPLGLDCVNSTIDLVETFNEGKDFCWCSDEFYVKANREIPKYESYGAFPQIENGVGLIAEFLHNFKDNLLEFEGEDGGGQKVALITGESFEKVLKGCAEEIRKKIKNITVDVIAVKNNFFGGGVTVSGLIVGGDIIAQVPKGYDKYVLPHNMLREFTESFLDDTTLSDVRRELGNVVVTSGLNGEILNSVLRG